MRSNRLHGKRQEGFQRFQRNRLFDDLLSLWIVILFFLSGCGGGTPPSSVPQKAKPPTVEKKKSEPIQGAEKKEGEKKEEIEYTYNPAGKADPFKPFIQLTSVKTSSKSTLQTPLQNYDMSQLKVVAIISTPEGNIALVEDSGGKGYFLKQGTWIGKNDGKVTKILKDKVMIEEAYQDIFGQTKRNEIILFLHRLEEGGES